MKGTDLIGYVYESAMHCAACAVKRNTARPFAVSVLERAVHGDDENGIPYAAVDDEGNPLSPIFVTTELYPEDCCDDCGAEFYGEDM